MKKEEVAELWIKIDKLHLQYLETVDDVAKLRIRSDLEDEVVKYLSIVPHDRRFVSLTTGDIITSTMMSHPNLSLPNIASSFRAVEQYASNLINDSGRTVPELWKIDQRSSFYAAFSHSTPQPNPTQRRDHTKQTCWRSCQILS